MIAPQFFYEKIPTIYSNFLKSIMLFKGGLGSKFLEAIKFHKLSIFPFKFNTIDELFLMVCMAYDEQVPLKDAERRTESLKKLRIPGFILFGENDNLISGKNKQRLHEILGIRDKTIIDNDISSIQFDSEEIKSIILKNAKHFPHLTHSDVIYSLIEKCINI